ncbi:hypothetical protein TNCV_3569051 [Trichonephila clavipes]|nr:hypothetical protein TNCV_3569051 [Trichonephila clavipes]
MSPFERYTSQRPTPIGGSPGLKACFNISTSSGRKVLRDIFGPDIDAINLEDLMSDTESDTESESFSESKNEPIFEFIPGTMDQLIQDMIESVPRR